MKKLIKSILILATLFAFAPAVFADQATSSIAVHLNIRYNDSVIYSSGMSLISGATTTATTTLGIGHDIPANSVLAALIDADASSTAMNISDLSFNTGFNSFYLNCINVTASSTPVNACADWQYVVNDTYPSVGMDKYSLQNNDSIYVYFGTPRRFNLSTTTTDTATPAITKVEKYNYTDNTWSPLSGTLVGATQTNPNDAWNPLVPFSTTTDATGNATLDINTPGTYNIGLAVDYYYPTTALTVTATSSASTTPIITNTATSTSTNENTSGGGGSNGSGPLPSFDINKAVLFLSAQQSASGNISSDLYTDWSTIGFAAVNGQDDIKGKLKNYLVGSSISSTNLTDYERRAMSLEALGVNPYNGTSVNYIAKILNGFDGVQFGDPSLVNDDMFAIFPLVAAGYGSNDIEIQKAVAFIISKQASDGSWGESVDLTSAAIQSLSLLQSLPEVSGSLAQAKNFIKNSQNSDGGFGNSDSTSWAIQAIAALNESPTSWTKNGKSPLDYLITAQYADGGLDESMDLNSRIWATAYSLPAYYGKTWDSILTHFMKPKTNISVTAGDSTPITSEIASSTEDLKPIIMPTKVLNLTVQELIEVFRLKGLFGDTIITW